MTYSLNFASSGCKYGDRPEAASAFEPAELSTRSLVYKLQKVFFISHAQSRIDHQVASIIENRDELNKINPEKLKTVLNENKQIVRSQGYLTDADIETLSALLCIVTEDQLGITLHRCQVEAGLHLLNGRAVEMQTGEGKTITALLPAVLAALTGTPVHVITANDYLAARDFQKLESVYKYFGLSAEAITADMTDEERRAAYNNDIIYITNKQIVFDYLRDAELLQSSGQGLRYKLHKLTTGSVNRTFTRGLCFAIVDELDSVVIDDAVVPLVLSREKEKQKSDNTDVKIALGIARTLHAEIDFLVNQNTRSVQLTDVGKNALKILSESLGKNWQQPLYRHELMRQALCAMHVFQKGKDYVIINNELHLLDPVSGRTLPDRKMQHGLQLMLELKERSNLSSATETVASISFQSFFQRYKNLCGMSGTLTECKKELYELYKLETVVVKPNKIRNHYRHCTLLERNRSRQLLSIAQNAAQIHATDRPVLIGTRSVTMSKRVSDILTAHELEHSVLNAEQSAEEATIIAKAGAASQITVATNMAGRGTDIKLGNSVAELGGLFIINTEINPSARIDRQLFGRASRQGDPGSGLNIYSLTDEMFRGIPRWLAESFIRIPLNSTTRGYITDLVIRLVQIYHENANRKKRLLLLSNQQALNNALPIADTKRQRC